MATLERIRSKGTLLLVVVGLALFAFIIGDFLNSGTTFWGQSRANIIEVDGDVIKIDQFQLKADTFLLAYEFQGTQASNDMLQEQARYNAYESLVREKLVKNATEKVGITVTEKELKDLVSGNNIHRTIRQFPFFQNEANVFDRRLLEQFLNQINTINVNDLMKQNPQQVEPFMRSKKYWIYVENQVRESQLETKYATLLAKALNANSLDAKFAFENNKNTADIAYVVKSYNSIPDSTLTVSSKELKAEYDLKKEQFKQENNWDIKYITFPVTPSKDDFAEAEAFMNDRSASFKTLEDVTDFVNSNSDIPYPSVNVSEASIDPDFKEFAFEAPKDSVSGLVFVNDTYKMARVIETGMVAPDSVEFRYIYLMNSNSDRSKHLSDSLLTVIKGGGTDFALLALQFSQSMNAENGGETGWVKENQVEKELVQPLFYENDNFFSARTPNGIYVVEVMEKTPAVKKVKLAVLSRHVNASNKTNNDIWAKANDYVTSNSTVEKFESAAQDSGYILRQVNVTANTPRINNLSADSRQIIKWALENNKKAVSDIYRCGDEFVVAAVTGIHKEGYVPMEDVRAELQASILRDKKAEEISKTLAEALKQNTSLSAFAKAQGLPLDSIPGVNFSDIRTKIGNEPAIVAIAPFMQANTVSAPIKGQNGVYVVSPYNVTVSTEEYNADAQKAELNTMYQFIVSRQYLEILKDKAEIIDNRSRFY